MKVQVVSDVHCEFYIDQGEALIEAMDPTDVDVLIVAGDLANALILENTLTMLCQRYSDADVLVTAGNHEYYMGSPISVADAYHAAMAICPNLTWLNNTTFEKQGVRFAGTTLWFPDDPLNVIYKDALNDFNYIQDFDPWVYDENRAACAFLEAEAPLADVVITHHLPSQECVNKEFLRSALNRFYVTPIADRLPTLPKVWIHGHTHTPHDFESRGCRFLANPKGYPRQYVPTFRPKLILEF